MPRRLALATLLALAACARPGAAPAPAPSPAAAAVEPADTAAARRLREAALGPASRVMETAIMLSDVHGPRLAGSPGYRAAAEWAVRTLRGYGLEARLEPWGRRGGRGWQLERHSVELVAPYYARIVAYPKAWSPSTAGTVRGTPIVVDIRGEGDIAKYAGRLRGAIVLNGAARPDTTARFAPAAHRFTPGELDSLARLTEPGDPKDYWEDAGGYEENVRRRQRLAFALREAGVAALLEPSRNPDAVMVSGYQAYGYDVSGAVPAFVVARADYDRLVNLAERGPAAGAAPTLELSIAARYVDADTMGYNVVADLPGSDPALRHEVVMVGGHFDTWTAGTGATDNAAGSAVAMEVVRLYTTLGIRPRRTVRVVLWDGEEHEDYYGSLGWVRKHLGDPATMRLLPGHDSVSAYFNFDNGTGRVRGLYLQGNAAARPALAGALAPFADLGAATTTIKNVGSTDHMPFVGIGVPAFTFIQDPIDYEPRTHHTNLDVAWTLLEGDLRQASAVAAGVVLHVANRAERLPRRPLPAARSGN